MNVQGHNFPQQSDELQLWVCLCLTQTLLYQLPYNSQAPSSHRPASPTRLHRQCFANAQGQTDKQSHRHREKPSISCDTCFDNTKHLISFFSSVDSSSGQELLYLRESQRAWALVCFAWLPLPQKNKPPGTSSTKKAAEKFSSITVPRCQPEAAAPSSRQARTPLIFETHDSAAPLHLDQCKSFILMSSHRAESTHISAHLPCSLLQSHRQKSGSSTRSRTGTAPGEARPGQLHSQVRVLVAVASYENIMAGTLQREGSWRTDQLLCPGAGWGKPRGAGQRPWDGVTGLSSQSLGNNPQGLLRSSTQPAGGAQNQQLTPSKTRKGAETFHHSHLHLQQTIHAATHGHGLLNKHHQTVLDPPAAGCASTRQRRSPRCWGPHHEQGTPDASCHLIPATQWGSPPKCTSKAATPDSKGTRADAGGRRGFSL